jgi:putative ABC transport system permease protein
MARIVDWLERAFRSLRRLAPRADHGIRSEAAAQTFRDRCREAHARGGVFALGLEGLAECWDVVRCVAQRRTGRGPGLITATRPRRQPSRDPGDPRGGLSMIDDFRQAARRLRARPSTTAIAVGTLALAIGISVAMFTIVDALVLRPAPFRNPETLAWLTIAAEGSEGLGSVNIPIRLMRAWKDSPAFVAVHAVAQESATFGEGENAESVAGARVTPGIFEELGVRPLLGRTFLNGEERTATDDVVLISEGLWRSRFAGDASIVGRRIEMAGGTPLVAGVLPDAFRFPFFQTRVWRPFNLDRSAPRLTGYAYARLAAGMSRDEAFRVATDALRAADPARGKARVRERPLGARLDPYSAGIVRILAAGVGLVFLLLCANVTILMLAAIGARRQEFAVCSALGASRARLLRQALIEQVAIGAAASIAGLSAAAGLVALAERTLPSGIIHSTLNPLDIDVRAAAATMLFALLAVLIAGALPAWIGTSPRTTDSLRLTSRGATPGRRARHVTSVMLVAEVAFAVALTAAAGLQLRSFVNLLHEDRGFEAGRLTTFRVSMPGAHFADAVSRASYAEAVRARLSALPGVEGTAVSRGVPPNSGDLHFYDVVPDTPGAAPVKLSMNAYDVAPEFFGVFGMRVLQGRGFQAGDSADAVVISQSMANALWPGGAPVVERSFSFMGRTFRVVGVVNDIRNPIFDPRQDEPEIYSPLLAPRADAASPALPAAVRLTVRCGPGCPSSAAVRAEIKAVNPLAVVEAGRRIADDYADGLSRPRAGAIVASAFAVIALAGIGGGLFAVLSRLVLQRQREFGIRLALGATSADLRRLVHNRTFALAGMGVAAGTAVAWLLSRLLAAVWYGVRTTDPMTWVSVVTVVAMTTAAAAWLPARRAMRVNPVSLLREE